MQEKFFFDCLGKSKDNVKLCGILSNPSGHKDKPIIIICHGFSANKGSFTCVALEEKLNHEAISTFRFDFFGHGESEGKFEEITVSKGVENILSAINFLKKQNYTKIGLIGSSFGGICSILAASKSKDLFVLGLKSPVSDFLNVRFMNRVKDQISSWKQNTQLTYCPIRNLRLNYSFYEDVHKLDVYKEAKKIKLPTIIVHGDEDDDVPLSQSIELVKVMKTAKLIIIKGADHSYRSNKSESDKTKDTLAFDTVIKLLSDFVIEHVKK